MEKTSQVLKTTIESDDELTLLTRLSVSQVEAGSRLLEDLNTIPEKMAFKISEAADLVGVKQHVLRFWENEFETFRPRKSQNGQRIYHRRDIETAMMIKKLLYHDRYSIEGARSVLREMKRRIKKEKSLIALESSQETVLVKLQSCLADVRRIRALFN